VKVGLRNALVVQNCWIGLCVDVDALVVGKFVCQFWSYVNWCVNIPTGEIFPQFIRVLILV
jgi:hypothetical protein